MVNQMLESFISQTKGFRMEIIKQLREPTKHPDQGILELSKDKLVMR